MKTAASIPEELFDSAEGTMRSLGITRSELYARALRDRECLAEHGRKGIKERLDEIYGGEQESGLDPVLAEIQRHLLERGDERGEGW